MSTPAHTATESNDVLVVEGGLVKICDPHHVNGWASNWSLLRASHLPLGRDFTVADIFEPWTEDMGDLMSGEHHLMFYKALYFGDTEITKLIAAAPTPELAKKFSYKIDGYDHIKWTQGSLGPIPEKKLNMVYVYDCKDWDKGGGRMIVMEQMVLAKLKRNPHLIPLLAATRNLTICEMEAEDTIWGTGFAIDDPDGNDPATWTGLNLMGVVWMKVRDDILEYMANNNM